MKQCHCHDPFEHDELEGCKNMTDNPFDCNYCIYGHEKELETR